MANPDRINDISGLHPVFAMRLSGLMQACGGISITSAWRSYSYQAQLYAEKPDLAAPPGHSNHEHMLGDGTPAALAADIAGNLDCAHDRASAFGLTFPMSYEPWHIEPVGVDEFSDGQAYTQPSYGAAAAPAVDLHDPATQLGFLESALLGTDQPWWSPEPIGRAGGLAAPDPLVTSADSLMDSQLERLGGEPAMSPDPATDPAPPPGGEP